MNLSKRIVSALLVMLLAISAILAGSYLKKQDAENIFDHTTTLHVWYTDDALTDYLGSMAVKYNEQYGIRIIPVLQSGLELLENINEASLSGEKTPDLFIATNDIIEKAYLSGLAMPIDNSDGAVGLSNFPESAVHAVTYKQEIIGYPFYYETSALLYNKTYLGDLAEKNIVEELKEKLAGEASAAGNHEANEEDGAQQENKSEDLKEEKSQENSSTDSKEKKSEENSSTDSKEEK